MTSPGTTTATPPTTGTRAPRPRAAFPLRDPATGRVAALDGLRGAAVVAVVAYHLWPDAVPAGFLGVSLFFTLSGFLITRLLLDEQRGTGTVDLRSFWVRRFRRLLPASLLTLLVMSVVWGAAGWLDGAVRGDVVASLLYVANWRFLFSGTAYGAATDASPVLHFWSLAIEEQFYVVFPLVATAAFRARRHPVAALGATAAALLGASLVVTAARAGDQQAVYFSSFTRAGEVLVGVLLAVGFSSPAVRRVLARLALLGAASATAIVALTVTTDFYTGAWSRGGLAGVGVLSALAVLGACRPGRFATLLAATPLVRLGGISYGVYLFHWPILVACRQLGWASWPTAAVTVVGSIGLALVSLRLVEDPIRRARWRRVRPIRLVLPVTALVAVALVWGGTRAAAPTFDFASLEEQVAALDGSAAGGSDDSPQLADHATVPGEDAPLPVAVFGDSTAVMLRLAMTGADERIDVRAGAALLGCPISRGGELKGTYEADEGIPGDVERCDWSEIWPAAVHDGGATTAIIYGGFWDTLPRRLPERWTGFRTIEDAVVADYLREEMLAITDALHAVGAETVAWVTLAPNTKVNSPQNIRRVEIYNRLLADVAVERPDAARVIDLGGWFAGQPKELRPDGVHVTEETGAEVVRTWLADQLLQASAR
jgi:peptidoglycan/LPS O-acetylase OafA/YrhL